MRPPWQPLGIGPFDNGVVHQGVAKGIGGLFSSILGGNKSDTPKPPKPPPVMPVPDDELIKADQLAKLRAAQSTGRSSTILSDSGAADKLG